MSNKGKIALNFIFVATPDLVEEGDKLWASHAAFLAETHPREGNLALLQYDVTKASVPTDPLDPEAKPSGNTGYALYEVYASEDGLANHWKMAMETWPDFGDFMAWAARTTITAVPAGPVQYSLW